MSRSPLLSGLGLLALAACMTGEARPDPPRADGKPVLETRHLWYAGRKVERRRYGVLVHPDRRVERHGEELEWYEDGTLQAERHFEHDAPVGTWKTWHPDGAPASEVEMGDGVRPAPMRFWHPNGQLAAEGQGIAGVKEGLWTFWYEDGTRSEEGSFRAAIREGFWTFWYPSGARRAEGVFEAGKRIGVWTLWDRLGQSTTKRSFGD